MFDVTEVTPLEDYRLRIRFEDGLQGVVSIDEIVARFDGVFAPLRDTEYFRQVRVDPEIGTIVWPNGADVCPDVLYSFVSGKPIDVEREPVVGIR